MAINRTFVLLVGVQFLLSTVYVLKFFSAPTFDAAVVFFLLSIGGATILFLLLLSNMTLPMPFSEPINKMVSPYILGALVGIYLVARFTSGISEGALFSLVPLQRNFLPEIGYSVMPLLQGLNVITLSTSQQAANTQLKGLMDVVLWNANVSASEEGFKVALTNIFALYFERRPTISQYALPVSMFSVVGIWTVLHEYNTALSTSGLIMAFIAGLILLLLTVKFKNYFPAVVVHMLWNIIASVV